MRRALDNTRAARLNAALRLIAARNATDDRRPFYVLHPGMVRSIMDGQSHYITAPMLRQLYGLPRSRGPSAIFGPPGTLPFQIAGWCVHDDGPFEREILPPGAIHLHPDPTGAYRLPIR